MDLGEQLFRYAFRLVVLIIVGRAGYLIFHRIKEGEKHKVIPILLRMCGYICIAFAVMLFLSPTGFVTYGAFFWIEGNVYDSETREPIEGVGVAVAFYEYMLKRREPRDSLFKSRFEEYPRILIEDDRVTSQGITNEHGYFILYAGYASGKVPFGYPLLGELGKKVAWVVYRKEGYQEHILKQNIKKWRPPEGKWSSVELQGTPDKIPDVYLTRVAVPDS